MDTISLVDRHPETLNYPFSLNANFHSFYECVGKLVKKFSIKLKKKKNILQVHRNVLKSILFIRTYKERLY